MKLTEMVSMAGGVVKAVDLPEVLEDGLLEYRLWLENNFGLAVRMPNGSSEWDEAQIAPLHGAPGGNYRHVNAAWMGRRRIYMYNALLPDVCQILEYMSRHPKVPHVA